MADDLTTTLGALRSRIAVAETRIETLLRRGAPHCVIQRARADASDLRIRAAGMAIMIDILGERAAGDGADRRSVDRAPTVRGAVAGRRARRNAVEPPAGSARRAMATHGA